ncbi:hypothetical protein FO519_004169 [Halicephalobus sp. NKZ332]|nr:hypothetical protein FO519_004169 [Halicephalobus sp. NKZ332]
MEKVDFSVTKPLVVVSGCTGTGKSDLAIAIAKRFGGDVISADSMQIYKGLDIVTNKVTEEEMDGVKHHLMSFYDPTMAEYNVHEFKSSVLEIVEDLWKEGKLPVIAGGTQYYVEGVIYKGNLVDEDEAQAKKNPEIREALEKMSNEELYAKLKEVDPESAQLVHKNNRSRVLRSVEICLLTGRKKSDIVEEQKKTDFDDGLRFKNTLLISIDADPKILDERLRKRIDKMISRGLEKELIEFYDTYRESLKTHGILQSIGLKEFLSFLELSEEGRKSEEGKKLFEKGAEALTLHTIQYAKRQRRWLKSRFLTRQGTRELPQIVGFDSSKADKFFSDLVPMAIEIVERFLKEEDLKTEDFPKEFVNDPLERISEEELRKLGHSKRVNSVFNCTTCNIDVHGEEAWKNHLVGRKHKRNSKKIKRVEA